MGEVHTPNANRGRRFFSKHRTSIRNQHPRNTGKHQRNPSFFSMKPRVYKPQKWAAAGVKWRLVFSSLFSEVKSNTAQVTFGVPAEFAAGVLSEYGNHGEGTFFFVIPLPSPYPVSRIRPYTKVKTCFAASTGRAPCGAGVGVMAEWVGLGEVLSSSHTGGSSSRSKKAGPFRAAAYWPIIHSPGNAKCSSS